MILFKNNSPPVWLAGGEGTKGKKIMNNAQTSIKKHNHYITFF
jgi:hypothetical protein